MSDSRSSSYSRLAWRLVRVGVYAALGGIILFFALTRTQVGRDALRTQLQSAFNARFAGSLEIGSLQGTLLNDLIATDITLRDPEGAVVATIDSLHTEPRWSDLMTANLSVESLLLVRPYLRLHRHADSTWTLHGALSRRAPPTDPTSRPSFQLTELTIQDGRISTTRAGTAPPSVQNRWVFDYTRSSLRDLDLEAAVEWTASDRRIALTTLNFQLPDQDLALDSAQVEIAQIGRASCRERVYCEV